MNHVLGYLNDKHWALLDTPSRTKVSFQVSTVIPKNKCCHALEQSYGLSSWFWDRQESEKNSSHFMSHPLLVPASAECGTPESTLHRHLQRSLKQERGCIGTVLSSCSFTDAPAPSYKVTGESTLLSRQHPVEYPPPRSDHWEALPFSYRGSGCLGLGELG